MHMDGVRVTWPRNPLAFRTLAIHIFLSAVFLQFSGIHTVVLSNAIISIDSIPSQFALLFSQEAGDGMRLFFIYLHHPATTQTQSLPPKQVHDTLHHPHNQHILV